MSLGPWTGGITPVSDLKVGETVALTKRKFRAIYRIVSLSGNGGGMIEVVKPINGLENVGERYSFANIHEYERVPWEPVPPRKKQGRRLEL